MKASELRIGNKLIHSEITTDKFGKVFSITAIFKDGAIQGTYSYEDQYYEQAENEISCRIDKLQAIPLTEEWLLKFGFKKNIDEAYEIETGRKAITISEAQDDGYCFLCYRCDIGMDYVGIDFVDYVHQLQDLYFALTGEELTIKANV